MAQKNNNRNSTKVLIFAVGLKTKSASSTKCIKLLVKNEKTGLLNYPVSDSLFRHEMGKDEFIKFVL